MLPGAELGVEDWEINVEDDSEEPPVCERLDPELPVEDGKLVEDVSMPVGLCTDIVIPSVVTTVSPLVGRDKVWETIETPFEPPKTIVFPLSVTVDKPVPTK